MTAQRLRIPAGPQETAVSLDLKKWCNGLKLARAIFFEAIDLYQATMQKIPYVPIDKDDDFEAGDASAFDVTVIPEKYVRFLAPLIEQENSLLAHLLKRPDVAIETRWQSFLEAAAWVVLQNYVRDRSKGEWPVE